MFSGIVVDLERLYMLSAARPGTLGQLTRDGAKLRTRNSSYLDQLSCRVAHAFESPQMKYWEASSATALDSSFSPYNAPQNREHPAARAIEGLKA